MEESLYSLNLDEFAPSIESKIEAIRSGVQNLPELEIIYREANRLLSSYEGVLDKCSRYAELHPELEIPAHRASFDSLLRKLHRVTLERRAALSKMASRAADRGALIRRAVVAGELRSPTDTLAQDITHSLHQMTRTLRDELLRSETSAQILQDSTKRMAATGEMFGALGGVLGTSKRLIGQMWRRERSERWLVMAALTVYGLVLLYILSRRLWLLSSLIAAVRISVILFVKGLGYALFGLLRLRNNEPSMTQAASSSLGPRAAHTWHDDIQHDTGHLDL